ncbi:MAG: hypothetical protein IPJ13_00400 [Saprospiraceae bacterium]|nr:hypothetical protein [Saprospiraceae bacterium]
MKGGIHEMSLSLHNFVNGIYYLQMQIKEKFYGQIKLLKLINKSKDMIRFVPSFTILIFVASVSTAQGKLGVHLHQMPNQHWISLPTSKGLFAPTMTEAWRDATARPMLVFRCGVATLINSGRMHLMGKSGQIWLVLRLYRVHLYVVYQEYLFNIMEHL